MGPYEQNQHFVELRRKVCLYIHVVVLQRGLPSLDGKLERFVTKKNGKSSCQTRVRQTITKDLKSVFRKRSLVFGDYHFFPLLHSTS